MIKQERDSGIPCAPSQESTNIEGGDSTKDKTKDEENVDCPYYMIMHIILRYNYKLYIWFFII